MTKSISIWVLTDFRIGNSVQAIAVADALGQKCEIKNIEYNFLARLPNCLLGNRLCHVKNKDILNSDHPPKMIISSGRRCAKVAEYLKIKYPDAKLIQIMKPNINTEIFDLIILPQHDVFAAKDEEKSKVVRTIGSLNNIKARIAKYKDLPRKYSSMKRFIGVLIGGNTKEYSFSKKNAEELCRAIENAVSYNDIPAFITFSRRTPDHMKKLFEKSFKWPNIIYDPTVETKPENNPYIGILKHAEFVIMTCDSVSMCSEVASSGKPAYIYSPNGFESKKHKYLLQQLIDLEIARPFSTTTGKLETYKYKPLDEISKVAKYIKNNIK
jgi:uncharacterized protein